MCGRFLALTLCFLALVPAMAMNAKAAEPQLAHMVYFKLKDDSPEATKRLVKACHKYLSGHEGTVFFGAGTVAEEFKREVNVRDFDVALQLVFKDKAAHDKYQDHPRHQKFIEEGRDNWESVRVFDAYLQQPSSSDQ